MNTILNAYEFWRYESKKNKMDFDSIDQDGAVRDAMLNQSVRG